MDDFSDKLLKTHEEKYGTFFNNKEQSKQTCQKRYNVDHPSKRPEQRLLQSMKSKNMMFNKFIENIPKEYELIKYDDILMMKHIICDRIFSISRKNYAQRKNLLHNEICTSCNPIYFDNTSQIELEFRKFIKNLSTSLCVSVRDVIPPYELDIYIPELKLVFEFNGTYWHSEKIKESGYHKLKSDLCDQQRIKLVHIWEHDWINKQEIVKSMISEHFNRGMIVGRGTITKIKNSDCKNFVNGNHIQKFVASTINYGFFSNNKLLGVASFQNKNDHWEIIQICLKNGVLSNNIVKDIWEYFIKENNPDKVITYCSRDYSIDNIYKNLGFKLEKITRPTYIYANRRHDTMSPNKNDEIMRKRGYFKCYNSGNYEFIYHIKPPLVLIHTLYNK